MTSAKYIGMEVHKENISIAVLNSVGKVVMECVIETKAGMIRSYLGIKVPNCSMEHLSVAPELKYRI